MRRLLTLAICLVALSSVSSAYYHWTYFAQRSGPFQAMRKRFDLAALQDSTVSFFIAKQGPAKMVAGDNFPALVSQIRRAAEVWNVAGSELKVKFGGLQEKSFGDVVTEQVTPGIDVVFDDDLPPGVLAYSDPITNSDLAYLGAANSAGFAPILRSRLQLASDLAARSQASYSDAFFLTIVHEFGHTLGLQHSMTGGAMATSITRGTNRVAPLSADDVAGISSLYPSAQFKATKGSIEGHVNVARNPANLASVVALSIDGTAVGAMTLPDGTYKIEGLPTGDYMVYAHPLPPAQLGEANPAGIVPPSDLQHAEFSATSGFQTRFYPNTKDWKEAARIHVDAGKTSSLIDFELDSLAGSGLYNLSVYAFLGAKRDISVHAPPLVPGFQDWLAFTARGALVPNTTTITPGLQVSVISDVAVLGQSSLRYYTGEYLLIGAATGGVGRATPVAMTMTVGDNLYILPNAFSVVPAKHPLLSAVATSRNDQGAWVATIAGENLNASTRVSFDGADALSVKANSDGTLTAIAPPAAGAQQAAVEVATPDGQTSWQLQGAGAPTLFAYDAPADPAVSITPGSVFAGTSVMLEINGAFTNFLPGKTAVGFGTSDIVVRQMWVMAPDRLLVNVTVNPNAKLGAVPVTISTGIQLVTLGTQLQVQPADAKQTTLLLPIVNDATGLAGAPAGATISLRATGVPSDIRGWSALINGTRTPLTRTEDGRLLAPIALGIEAGPKPVQLLPSNGGPAVPPVWFQIDSQPPSISSVGSVAGLIPTAQQQLHVGDRVVLTVSNLVITNAGDGTTPATKDDVEVRVAGIAQRVEILAALPTDGLYRVEFVIPAGVPAGDAQPVVVRVGTRVSAATTISIAAQADVVQ